MPIYGLLQTQVLRSRADQDAHLGNVLPGATSWFCTVILTRFNLEVDSVHRAPFRVKKYQRVTKKLKKCSVVNRGV